MNDACHALCFVDDYVLPSILGQGRGLDSELMVMVGGSNPARGNTTTTTRYLAPGAREEKADVLNAGHITLSCADKSGKMWPLKP